MVLSKSVLVILSLTATSSGFLLEGLGLGGLGPQRQQCCCPPPPPPPPCGGGYEAPPPPPPSYAPPPPPPPSYASGPSYAGSYGPQPYKARSKRASDLKASSEDLFCNSVQVRDLIKKGMTNDEKTSRETITSLLKVEMEREYVVICAKQHFDYLASADSEFCSVTNSDGITCSTFVF